MEENKDLAQWIRKAGKTERVGEFRYPYANVSDFHVKIAYASKFIWNQIREVAKEPFRNPRTREMDERLNEQKMREEYAARIIQGWRGLTSEKLQKLIPQMEVKKEDFEKDIPFSYEVALAIMDTSIDFENWVVDIAIDSNNYQHVAKRKEEQYENLK